MKVSCNGDACTAPCDSFTGEKNGTAFTDILQYYSKAKVQDLNPSIIPYVVMGNYGSMAGRQHFDPAEFEVRPLSVVAVVCGDKLVSTFSMVFQAHQTKLTFVGLWSLGRCELEC